MAGDDDKESKTEEATDRQISQALEKGNVPFSREAPLFASLAAMLVCLVFLIPQSIGALAHELSRFIDDPGGFSLESGSDATALLWGTAMAASHFLLPSIITLSVAGLAAALLQNSPAFVLERIRPKWNRISLASGWGRTFSGAGLIEFLKSLFKFTAVAVLIVILCETDQYAVINAMFSDPVLIPALLLSLATRLVSAVCVGIIVLVALDLVWSRVKWRRDLRMTKQDIKEEMKQTEGDPLVKARLRSLAKDRARQRMMTAVPKASFVVANPTHYAVALRYQREEGGAPIVVAKGADLLALRIREIATKHAIPIIEDKPLARALYDSTEVDQWIPPEFYRAVAKILYFLYSREK